MNTRIAVLSLFLALRCVAWFAQTATGVDHHRNPCAHAGDYRLHQKCLLSCAARVRRNPKEGGCLLLSTRFLLLSAPASCLCGG